MAALLSQLAIAHLEVSLQVLAQNPDVDRGIEAGAHVEKVLIDVRIDNEKLNAGLRHDVLYFSVGAIDLSLREEDLFIVVLDICLSLDCRHALISQPHPVVGNDKIAAGRRHQAKANKIVPNPDQRFFFFAGEQSAQTALQITRAIFSNGVVFLDVFLRFGRLIDELKHFVLEGSLAERDQSFIFDDLPQGVGELGSGYPVYGIVRVQSNVPGAMKNLIFASIGEKPELVFIDAINNDVKIVKNEDKILIFDRPLPPSGQLLWKDLVKWWQLISIGAKSLIRSLSHNSNLDSAYRWCGPSPEISGSSPFIISPRFLL